MFLPAFFGSCIFLPLSAFGWNYYVNVKLLRFGILMGLIRASLAAAQPSNSLSEAETAAGWQLMFDGKTLSGWHSFRKSNIIENGWIIKDSSIYLRGPAAGSLLAPEEFVLKNFEISLDWKAPDSGNSGIFLRYLETEASENVRTGPESQVCGKLHSDYKGGVTATSPGACYGMYAPAKPWIRSAEEYNTFRVVMYENHVAHFGNGVRLLEYRIGSTEWKAKYEASKYASFPLYGDIHAGKLLLQDHATPVWYRNLKIRPLTQNPWNDSAYVWPDQETAIALRPLPGSDGGRMGAPGGIKPGWLRFSPGDPGRILVDLSPATAWQVGLRDARGTRIAEFNGVGPGSRILGASLRAPGVHFLTGNAGGRPLAKPIRMHPSP
jgi:3-keto-disaccharide hydrolase